MNGLGKSDRRDRHTDASTQGLMDGVKREVHGREPMTDGLIEENGENERRDM